MKDGSDKSADAAATPDAPAQQVASSTAAVKETIDVEAKTKA
jgi:hypothetical protein